MKLYLALVALAALVATAACEFQQTVLVEPSPAQPGAFRVRFRSQTYNMVPEETSTGAVRLADARAGVVWIQIPVKSMLMNTRLGQRMVDACMQPGQRMAAAEADAAAALRAAQAAQAGVPGGAGTGLGIAPGGVVVTAAPGVARGEQLAAVPGAPPGVVAAPPGALTAPPAAGLPVLGAASAAVPSAVSFPPAGPAISLTGAPIPPGESAAAPAAAASAASGAASGAATGGTPPAR